MSARDARVAVLRAAREMSRRGLSAGTSGNVSARAHGGMVVTPSAMPYEEMREDHLVAVDLDGRLLRGERRPTTEWPLHAAVYRARADVDAVVHAHATFCTTLATLRRDVPAFHYMIAVAGGDSIRCAPYAPFGSSELAGNAVTALEGRQACLLANHGVVTVGASPDEALSLLGEVEHLMELYWRALQVGEPSVLDASEMREAMARFARYRRGGRP